MTSDKHHCAVCDRQIANGLLMCLPHWKLVPTDQQQAVYRSWSRYRRADGGMGQVLRAQRLYFAARDAAIASAQAALGQPTTTTTTTGEA